MTTIIQLFLNPAIISLFLGTIAGIFESVELPKNIMSLISIYLIFTIGFKGGACLGVANECTPPLIALTCAGIIIGFIQPFINNIILKKTTSLDPETTAVVAAEYGSISIVTFITSLTFLSQKAIPYNNFMMALAGIMEIPAIFAGLILLQKNKLESSSFIAISKDILKCKKISSIFVGFTIGFLFKSFDLQTASDFIITPFTVALVLFMFDIGTAIGLQKNAIKAFNRSIFLFAIGIPIINGTLGVCVAKLFVSTAGTAVLFAILLASASYIAVPAIMRLKAPNAIESIYLPMSLGITLPFNVLIGLPYYIYIASFIFPN